MIGNISTARRQRGVVLFISMIMLIVIGMLTVTLMGMSRVETRMANNEEARINALQAAQAMSDLIVSRPDMTPVIGTTGYTFCVGNLPNCDEQITSLPANSIGDAVADGYLTASATRADPEFRPPPRGMGFSASKFVGTSFALRSTFDATAEGQGQGEIEEGLMVLIPQ